MVKSVFGSPELLFCPFHHYRALHPLVFFFRDILSCSASSIYLRGPILVTPPLMLIPCPDFPPVCLPVSLHVIVS